MDASSIVISLLTSIAANGVSSIPSILKSDKDLMSHIAKCYKKAVAKWEEEDKANYMRDDLDAIGYEKFKKYIDDKRLGFHPKIKQLYEIWIEEMLKDQVCSNFLTQHKLDTISQNVKDNKQTTEDISSTVTDIQQKVSEISKTLSQPTTQQPSAQTNLKEADRKVMYELFCHLNCYDFDSIFIRSHEYVPVSFVIANDTWNGYYQCSTFVIYDKKLKSLFEQFMKNWNELCSNGCHYYSISSNPELYHWGGQKDSDSWTHDEYEMFYKLLPCVDDLEKCYKEFITYVKEDYQIDLSETSHIFVDNLKTKIH